jgi:hypothetical protein
MAEHEAVLLEECSSYMNQLMWLTWMEVRKVELRDGVRIKHVQGQLRNLLKKIGFSVRSPRERGHWRSHLAKRQVGQSTVTEVCRIGFHLDTD